LVFCSSQNFYLNSRITRTKVKWQLHKIRSCGIDIKSVHHWFWSNFIKFSVVRSNVEHTQKKKKKKIASLHSVSLQYMFSNL
jgi:intergrase/recombinase